MKPFSVKISQWARGDACVVAQWVNLLPMTPESLMDTSLSHCCLMSDPAPCSWQMAQVVWAPAPMLEIQRKAPGSILAIWGVKPVDRRSLSLLFSRQPFQINQSIIK